MCVYFKKSTGRCTNIPTCELCVCLCTSIYTLFLLFKKKKKKKRISVVQKTISEASS